MASTKVGAKKSLFKKPAWAATSTRNIDNDAPIFGQAHHYQEIVEREKELKAKAATKQKQRAEKVVRKEQNRESKRRRISKEAEDSDYGSDSDVRSIRSRSVGSRQSQKSASTVQDDHPREERSPPQKRKSRLVDQLDATHSTQTRSPYTRSKAQDEALILDDDDIIHQHNQEDDDLYGPPKSKTANPKHQAKQPDPESESEEEDEYLRELKVKARQEARLKKLGIGMREGNTPGSPAIQTSANEHSPLSADQASPTTGRTDIPFSRASSTPIVEEEPEVKIWIRTIIPHAKEIIVNRKISQPLNKVKEFWIMRNELDPAIADRVFFTWNGTRLYNSTTMRGIIGRLKKTHPTHDGSDPSDGKITIEAVTDEIFEYRQKQRARRLAEAEGQMPNTDQADNHASMQDNINNDAVAVEDGTPPPPPPPQPVKPGIVIRLKAQGLEEFPIRTRPNTSIFKILGAFRHFREIDPDKEVWLSYDGERLEEMMTVQEVGFEHDDSVEVYMR